MTANEHQHPPPVRRGNPRRRPARAARTRGAGADPGRSRRRRPPYRRPRRRPHRLADRARRQRRHRFRSRRIRRRSGRTRVHLLHPDQHPQPARRRRRRTEHRRIRQPVRPRADAWAPPWKSSAAAIPRCAATSSPRSQAIDAARRRVTGTGFDGVLLVPAYFEAGRFTAGDIHWANVAGRARPGRATASSPRTPPSVTPRPTCGTSSPRRAAAPSPRPGAQPSPWTTSGSAGPTRVAEILAGVTGGAFVVVNATDYADLEIVVLGRACRRRSGASRSDTVVVRRSPVLWPGSNLKARSPRRRSGRPVVRAATGSSSSVRMLA